MTDTGLNDDRNTIPVEKLKQRIRALLLIDASERAGISPISTDHLHAFAYLADVLSPVWELEPFEGKVYKTDSGPHYPELQDELDTLIALGLIEVSNIEYVDRGEDRSRIVADYALRFSSEHLDAILGALGARSEQLVLDPEDARLNGFLVELAGALATTANDAIDSAAELDVSYRTLTAPYNIADFAEWVDDKWSANPSWRAMERFRTFLPEGSSLTSGEKLYLYATYLGRLIHAA